jgi:catechol 2,3-dioxygenase
MWSGLKLLHSRFLYARLEPSMNLIGVVINVADLDRSIGFYREVLGFTLLSKSEQLAAVSAPGNDRAQVIMLRAFPNDGLVDGGGHIGLRALVLDVESADHLERIASDLGSRRLLVGRQDHGDWTAAVGRDPDGVALAVGCVPGPNGFTDNNWRTLDDFFYGIGE